MSDLVILTQPRACQQAGIEFFHAPGFAWYVRSLVDNERYADILESDVVLESLALPGDDTWKTLAASELIRDERLAKFRELLVQPDGSSCFYPLLRLRHSDAMPLALTSGHSPEEHAYENEQLLEALAANRLQMTRAARQRLGSGELSHVTPPRHASAIELLEVELSDASLVLGWGWVWYPV